MTDSPDHDELAAMNARRARLRQGACEIVAKADRGDKVDPYSLEWARQVVRNNRPDVGWLGESE